MAERAEGSKQGMRWAAASALAAVGASLIFDRVKARRPFDEAEAEQEAFGSRVGRGEPGEGPSRQSRRAGYETTDANARSLVLVMIVSVTFIGGGLTAVFVLFGHFQRVEQAPNASLTAAQRAPIDPPLPHLQAAPVSELDSTLLEQSRRLATYGWNSPDHTTAHIPIERAMQQVVGKPLDGPAQADAKGPPGTGQPFPNDPALNALIPTHKAPIVVPGEGRPMNIAPTSEKLKPESNP